MQRSLRDELYHSRDTRAVALFGFLVPVLIVAFAALRGNRFAWGTPGQGLGSFGVALFLVLLVFTIALLVREIFLYGYQKPRVLVILCSFSLPVAFAPLYDWLDFAMDGDCVIGAVSFWDHLYFSYTTYTTVGFGDFAPTGLCRVLTSAQAVIGLSTIAMIPAAFVASLLKRDSELT